MTFHDIPPHPALAENAMLRRALNDLLPHVRHSRVSHDALTAAMLLLGKGPLPALVPETSPEEEDRVTRLRKQFDEDDCA